MILAHLRLRRRLGLLAAGVLEGSERDAVRRHLDSCPRCRGDYARLRAVVAALEADPVRCAEPELPVALLLDRVERRLERTPAARGAAPIVGWRIVLPAAAATALLLALLGPARVVRFRSEPSSPPALSAEVLDRLERNVAREHAARYLSEARDVLVAVAATEADCEQEKDRLDVGEAPDRSRDLLTRRALLVEGRGEAVASAQAVLDDVELALREVADLPSCVRRRDVQQLREHVERRRLLMRIRLLTRELEG